MAIVLEYESSPGVFTSVDTSTLVNVKLSISYQHAAFLSFGVIAPQHTTPIPRGAFVAFYDDASFSFADPLFEGFVQDAIPAGSNLVTYTAYDPTAVAGSRLYVYSIPTVFSEKVPRLVYNVPNNDDPDYAWARGQGKTAGQMLTDILSDSYADLVSIYAAPPLAVGGPAYEASDMTGIDFIPQGKVVFQADRVTSAVKRLLSFAPARRLLFYPGTGADKRKWRFVDALSAPSETLTLGDYSNSTRRVLSYSLTPNYAQGASAYKIYGPARSVQDSVFTPTTLLGEGTTWTLQQRLNLQSGGIGTPGTQDVYRVFQVADPAKRRLAKTLPQEALVTTSLFASTALVQTRTKVPALVASWDNGASYQIVNGTYFDPLDGKIYSPVHILKRDGSNNIVWPDRVGFIFAYLSAPLSARAPDSGYEGTVYTQLGIAAEAVEYDENLASGIVRGVAEATTDRINQYKALARKKLDAIKDVVWTGGATLEGLQYDLRRLQKRFNFTAVTPDGAALTTGWESINAILTDVEYDYSANVTTLVFSSDKMEYLQTDPERLKQILKIKVSSAVKIQRSAMAAGVGGFASSIGDQAVFVDEHGVPLP